MNCSAESKVDVRGLRVGWLTVMTFALCATVASLTTLVWCGEPKDRSLDEAAADELPLDSSDQDHWSYLPLEAPPVPSVTDGAWANTAVDRFILRRLEDDGLHPQAMTDRRTLIRRLSFDLLGIPPTLDDFERFLADRRPDAYERLVERYLVSPRHGEHLAQFWLDLARFAETDGFEHDKERPKAWRYRDWVVSSLNAGMPYDTFLSLQVAGDLLHPGIASARNATAFCLSGPDMPDINSQDERFHNVLNEMTGTVGEVLLGLQFQCAQCHDHKYDAISQADFYRLRAIFEPGVSVKRNKSLETLDERDNKESRQPRLWIKGDWRRPGPTVVPAFPRVVNSAETRPEDLAENPRVAFARWLTGGASRITARVMVNRMWQLHFGNGFTDSPNDVGVVGDTPTHPKLIEWLAADFRSDWSLKRLQRTIVLSSVYRQASRPVETTDIARWKNTLAADPDGTLLSRFPRRRVRAEVVRDAMLVAAGSMFWKQGGPGVRPPLPAELRVTLLRNQWNVTEDRSEHFRRSLFVFARRNLRYPVLEAFDRPDANASCGKRAVSTTAPQALFMLNSSFSWQLARRLAMRVASQSADPAQRIRYMFRATFTREPTAEEISESLEFLSATEDDGISPLTELALVLFNSNEFYYID